MNIILHAEELKSLRDSIGVSQSKLAKETNINRSYLSQFESGKRLLEDHQMQVLVDYLQANGAEIAEEKTVTVNGVVPKYDIRQKDGFILPVNYDEANAEEILNSIYERTDKIEGLLKQQIPEDGIFPDKDQIDESKLEELKPVILGKENRDTHLFISAITN